MNSKFRSPLEIDDGPQTVDDGLRSIVRTYENACNPVCALPKINAWMSCVPS